MVSSSSNLKGLRKALNTYYPQSESGVGTAADDAETRYRTAYFNKFKGLPFWGSWNVEEHKRLDIEAQERNDGRTCCFMHQLGLPEKYGVPKPLFPYQRTILDAVEQHKRLVILKASSLGVSELFLRYMCHLCLKDDTYKGSQMIIITGPNLTLSNTLIERIKRFFISAGITFDSDKHTVELGGVRIRSYPSHHLSATRGLESVSAVLCDEADFFGTERYQWEETLNVTERLIPKSNPFLWFISTPWKPAGLMEYLIKQEPSIYKKLLLPYTVAGTNTIYLPEELEIAKQSDSFNREYNIQFAAGTGTLLNRSDILRCRQLGELVGDSNAVKNNPEIIQRGLKTMGIDVGYGSSPSAAVILSLNNYYFPETNQNQDIIQVLHSEQWERSSHEDLVYNIMRLLSEYNMLHDNSKLYIDMAGVALIRSLKINLSENEEYHSVLRFAAKNNFRVENMMRIIPIAFGGGLGANHKQLLQHMRMLIQSGYLGIHKSHEQLLIGLESATERDLTLLKNLMAYPDLVDALRLGTHHYRLKGNNSR